MAKHKAEKVLTRRQIRKHDKRVRLIALGLLASLAAGSTTLVMVYPSEGFASDAKSFDVSKAVTSSSLVSSAASRSSSRDALSVDASDGSWDLDSNDVNTDKLTRVKANSPVVADLIDGRDRGQVPAGFNPNHATGDTGNAYAFSQCTWWAYVRRHQLGLPAGSHMGNGAQWADTARSLGYWVDRTPRVGDVMVFQRGQEGSSPIYGHVAIVEAVNPDGSVTTSECGASYHGKPFSRTFKNVSDFQYIHY